MTLSARNYATTPFDPNNNVMKDTVVVFPILQMGELRLGEVAKVTD